MAKKRKYTITLLTAKDEDTFTSKKGGYVTRECDSFVISVMNARGKTIELSDHDDSFRFIGKSVKISGTGDIKLSEPI